MIRIAHSALLGHEPALEAPEPLEKAPVDFLIWDCQGEATAVRLERLRREDPSWGYAEEFPELIERSGAQLRQRGVRVLSAAGGANPLACARDLRRRVPELTVAAVMGGDVTARLEEFAARGHSLAHVETGAAIDRIRDRILRASVELDAGGFEQALGAGAQVVITSWPAGPALALAAATFRFGWRPPDWNRFAAGAIAGHLLAGGARLVGATCAGRQTLFGLHEAGCPVVELFEDGCFELAPLAGTAGRIDAHAVKQQLLCGIGDPRAFETPDCTADLTHLAIEELAAGRVRVTGARGRAPAGSTRLWIAYQAGWKAQGALLYCWPDAFEKARAADCFFRRRLERLGLSFEETHSEYLGGNACLGPAAPPVEDYPEVELRIAVRTRDREAAQRSARELAELARIGPPFAASFGDRPACVEEVIGFWPTLVSRSEIQAKVEVVA